MTLTLNLTPAEEARLTTAARHAGVAPDAFLKKFVNSLPPNPFPAPLKEKQGPGQKPVAAEARWEKSPSLRGLGMFAHISGGSEQYAQEKQAQIVWEERPRG